MVVEGFRVIEKFLKEKATKQEIRLNICKILREQQKWKIQQIYQEIERGSIKLNKR